MNQFQSVEDILNDPRWERGRLEITTDGVGGFKVRLVMDSETVIVGLGFKDIETALAHVAQQARKLIEES